jgi:hypothetical protein
MVRRLAGNSFTSRGEPRTTVIVPGCPDADTVSALVAGTLDEAGRAAVANHAATCEVCHALIETLVEAGAHDPTISGDELATGELVLRPGTHVGRYVVAERLGAGGMGVVYAAVDSELHRRVALKLLRPDQGGDTGSHGRERLLREARTLARLSHPNVVTVFDVGTHHGHLFLAMELVDGGSLTGWLRERREPDEIIDRMIEAGRGLAAAHSAGVVHRDVKPDNILIGSDGRARVTDFGLARQGDATPTLDERVTPAPGGTLDVLTRTGTLMGTPVYMPPEQLQGQTNPQTDQWSFCATFYEALAGVRPFPVDKLDERLAAIKDGRIAAPLPGRRVPAWLRQIISRGLRADPAARWPSMSAVVTALARRRHRRRNVAFAIAGALAVTGVAIGFYIAGHEAPPPSARRLTRTTSAKWVDPRPGCNCPYSACDLENKKCLSVCSASDFDFAEKVPGINTPERQDALVGAAHDGNTLLYLTGEWCALDRLMLARRVGETFVPVDLTDQVDPARLVIREGCCTLSADGTSILIMTRDTTSFVEARLTGDQLIVEPTTVGALIPDPGPSRIVRNPVLSADGLTLYYRLEDTVEGEVGPLDGNYVATRPDRQAPFTTPKRMKGRARGFEYVSGVSSDGLSLFMSSDFETRVLVRATTSDPFGDPAQWLAPAVMHGWRAVPLADCRRILTTHTPGGCANEDIAYLVPVP